MVPRTGIPVRAHTSTSPDFTLTETERRQVIRLHLGAPRARISRSRSASATSGRSNESGVVVG